MIKTAKKKKTSKKKSVPSRKKIEQSVVPPPATARQDAPAIVLPTDQTVSEALSTPQPTPAATEALHQSTIQTPTPPLQVSTPLPDNANSTNTPDTTSVPSSSSSQAQPTQTSDDDFEPEEKGGSWKMLLIIFISALAIGAAGVGGILYLQSDTVPSQVVEEQEASPSAQSPSTSPVEEEATDSGKMEQLDLSPYAVQILNGAGVPGAAGTVRDLLTVAGFEDFTVGNAGTYEYVDTEVQAKKSVSEDVYGAIENALDDYSVVKSDTSLEETADFDVVIIVGQKS